MQEPVVSDTQLKLWNVDTCQPEASEEGTQPILFRNSVPEIGSTTAATFGIYRYPAKFIPQVIAYVIKQYAIPGMTLFDPFAGYGTVGVVSRVYGYDYDLWDLNPLMKIIHDTATADVPRLDVDAVLQQMRNSTEVFTPRWSHLDYWHPEPFIPLLQRAWGFVHSQPDEVKTLLTIPLMKVTRFFSHDDEKVHKLYRSRRARAKIEALLQDDWEATFWVMLRREVFKLVAGLHEYHQMSPRRVNAHIRAGIDTLHTCLEREVSMMITSPPYLQAQEYIRSTKLELFWLGYSEEDIRWLSSREIPYRRVEPIPIYSELFHKHRAMIEEPHLLALYDAYFHAIVGCFTRLAERVTDYLCIFVGPAKVRTVPIPIDEIIREHLQHLGWRHVVTYVDQIVSRVMFKSQVNPASGLEESRMKTEHMLVLRRY